MTVSFIIPSYNSLKTLPQTIDSLLKQTVDGAEIIVVDSSDDEMAKKYLSVLATDRIKVISLDKKTIPALARNLGARMAKGELLCFVDSDVVLAFDWLEKIKAAYQDGCLAGGGAIFIPESQKNNRIALAQLYLQFNEYLNGAERLKRLFVPSCNMFCDRKLFEESGGFPDVRASEDTLFFLQLQNKAAVYFVPEAKCYHIFREQKEAFLKNQFLLGKYVSIYRKEYYKSWIYQGIMPVVLTPLFLLVKIGRIVSRIVKAGPEHFRHFLWISPAFCLGFIWWSGGFIKGFIYDDRDSRR